MARARIQVCSCIGCPAHEGSCPGLITARHCEACGQQREQQRGSRQQRGYDRGHDRLRRKWKPKVEAGLVDCHAEVCVLPQRRIWLGMDWDLGHTADRKGWTGPEHTACNRSAGGKAAHR